MVSFTNILRLRGGSDNPLPKSEEKKEMDCMEIYAENKLKAKRGKEPELCCEGAKVGTCSCVLEGRVVFRIDRDTPIEPKEEYVSTCEDRDLETYKTRRGHMVVRED